MSTVYRMIGSVRGSCGHNHRTIAGAAKCGLAGSKGCKKQGGYSDRSPKAVENGEVRSLSDSEYDEYLEVTNAIM